MDDPLIFGMFSAFCQGESFSKALQNVKKRHGNLRNIGSLNVCGLKKKAEEKIADDVNK